MGNPRAVIVWLGLAAACGGGNYDFLGNSPEEAGAELAERGCATTFECGEIMIDDSTDPCTAQYGEPSWATPEACEAQLGPAYADLLRGCDAYPLSAAQIADVNECFNIQRGCLSAADLAELAQDFCGGDTWGPPACRRAAGWLQLCQMCAQDPPDPGCGG
jgi:hypothetical protein